MRPRTGVGSSRPTNPCPPITQIGSSRPTTTQKLRSNDKLLVLLRLIHIPILLACFDVELGVK